MKARSTARRGRAVATVLLVALFEAGCHRSENSASPWSKESLQGTHRSNPGSAAVTQDHRASQLLGEKVENEDGRPLGRVSNLLLDGSGRVKFAVVSSGGVLGFGDRLVAVPGAALSSATAKRKTLAVNVSRAGWLRAPSLKGNDLAAELANPATAHAINRFFDGTPPIGTNQAAAANTWVKPEASDELRSLRRARDLLGARVVGRQQRTVGRVIDLLVDLSGAQVGYAIVLVEALLDRPQPVAVPVSILQNVHGKLQLRLNPKQFELASGFDEQRWLRGGNQPAEVFKFSK